MQTAITRCIKICINSLLNTQCTDRADTYFILKDFRSYAEAQKTSGRSLQRSAEMVKNGNDEYDMQREIFL